MNIGWLTFVCLAVLLVRGVPANAEDEASSPVPYASLDSSMRAEALNERCSMLDYFEVRTIYKAINDAAQHTPEGQPSNSAAGQSWFEETFAKYNAMLNTHRKQAKADVSDRPCTGADADITADRSAYVPFYLRAMLAARSASELNFGLAGQKRAAMQLGQFALQMFGGNYQSVARHLAAQNSAEGVTPSSAWKDIQSSVYDAVGQIRLGEKNWVYRP